MARAEVVQVRCDRCKRVELAPMGSPKKEPDFQASFLDKKLVYEDLCSRCRESIKNSWKELEQWDRPVTHQFGPTVSLAPNTAPPLVPAPDYSPPKPHSLIAGKK
jgi:hypothetical protein